MYRNSTGIQGYTYRYGVHGAVVTQVCWDGVVVHVYRCIIGVLVYRGSRGVQEKNRCTCVVQDFIELRVVEDY
jgi:hypothetical protein